MKSKAILLTFLMTAVMATAGMVSLFSSWDETKNTSHDIVIVSCGKPIITKLPPHTYITGVPKVDSEVQIILVLKGTNRLGLARLQTDHELRQGENYLVFGNFRDRLYTSREEFRIVPLGEARSTNYLSGKPLDEQIKLLFQEASFNLDREIKKDQEQKQQLEMLIGESK